MPKKITVSEQTYNQIRKTGFGVPRNDSGSNLEPITSVGKEYNMIAKGHEPIPVRCSQNCPCAFYVLPSFST